MKTTIKNIFSISIPFILIILAYVFFTKTVTMSQSQLDIVKSVPYGIFLIGLVIAWKFNRSRDFFILLVLTLCLISINYATGLVVQEIESIDIYTIVSLMIPINIALFSFFKERGIFSLWGFIRIGFIIFQLLFALGIIYSEERIIIDLINKDLLTISFRTTGMSQISIVAFLITFIILVIRHILYKSYQEISFIGVLSSLFYVLHKNGNQTFYSIFFGIGGIILIISIIQDSYSMAFSDELTGLPSRRALKQDMMKLGPNYVIAMVDIDFFKKFNDTYGHDTGDEVLRLIASIMKDVTGGGKSYRYGGEEFTIIFPGKSVKDALPHLEELRETISKRGFTPRGKDRPKKKPKRKTKSSKTVKQVKITVSIGVSQKNDRHRTPDEVLKSADTALYRAKKKGRNCVSK